MNATTGHKFVELKCVILKKNYNVVSLLNSKGDMEYYWHTGIIIYAHNYTIIILCTKFLSSSSDGFNN